VNNKEKLYLAKQAGYWSEMAGTVLNPINHMGGNLVGSVAALATPTQSLKEQGRRDSAGVKQVLRDLLIPGVGPYNSMKRVGTSIRGSELKEMKAEADDSRLSKREAKKDKNEDSKEHDKKDKKSD
jgi:hypothetical protein